MSDIKVNSITNLTGDGAPDFPQGATFGGGQMKWQEKVLSSSVTVDGIMSSLTFPLEVGKTYRISGQICAAMQSSDDSLKINISQTGGSQVAGIYMYDDVAAGQLYMTSCISTIFTADGTALTFDAVSPSAGAIVIGSVGRDGTYIILEELPNHVAGVFS